MEFGELKRSHLKRNMIIALVVVAIISAVVLNFTQAKYKLTESIPLINGTINYKRPDLNVVALYQQNESGEYVNIDTVPTSGYTLNTSLSVCGQSVNGELVEDSTIPITYENGRVYIGINTKGTKCYLYFDEIISAKDYIIANKIIDNSRSGEITRVLTENTTGTLFTAEDDYGTSYVYAGNVDNNWISFAGYYWRIIRINGDGSIRLIYSGDSASGPVETGEATHIRTSAFNEQSNDNAYVGYMYGSTGANSYSATHTNTNNSTIKGIIDTWYENNILNTEYEQYISAEQGFCNDRSINNTSDTWWKFDTKLGYGTNGTAYAPYGRLLLEGNHKNIQNPTLKCNKNNNDLFTVIESSKGNHALIYPIGLITVDEIVLGGGLAGTANNIFYLYTNQAYWTMSPTNFSGAIALVFDLNSGGSISYGNWVNNLEIGVRPVINLDANVTIISGDGTSSNPYIIAT